MATERIDIIVQEKGSRVVKRRLEDIGDVATRSVRGLRLLQNALFVLGGAGLLAGLGRLLDTITNFENRLRLVTDSTAEFNAVQTELFNVAARARAEFESTATIFTRTALATRELSVSQQELLNFTESLNQATILSGASVREANAALIQLSQGMASGTLRGDELRSVLEQLPFVADVIAKQMGVTRGELRLLGTEGKINAEIILEAFRNAREEIAGKFAETVPTVGQAFSVLRTEFLRVLDNFDDLIGGSEAVARAIIGIAESLNFLLAGLTAAYAGFAAFKFATFIGGIVNSIRASRELAAAVAQGNAVLLTSVEIERAKAASQLQSATAAQAQAASTVRQIQLDVTQLQTQRALLTQQQASIVIDNTKRRARDALTGRFIAYNAALAQNIRTNIALTRTETALAAARGNLTRATATQTAAEAALATAQGRSAAAGAAASTFTARLARAFPGLAAGARGAGSALSGLARIASSNPYAAIAAAIIAVVATLVLFSDKIPIAGEEFVTLRDVGIATFQLIGEAIAPVINLISEGFTTALNYVSGLWNKFKDFIGQVLMAILGAIKSYINFYIGLWVGLMNSIIKAWEILPAALIDLGAIAVNGLIDVVKGGTEAVVRAVGDLLEFIGSAAEKVGLDNPFAGLLDDFSVDLDRFRPEITGAAREVGQIFNDEFSDALSTDYIGNAWTAILVRAREIAAERIANLDATNPRTAPGSGDGSGDGTTFEEIVQQLTLQNELLRVNAAERERLQAILKIEDDLKRSLTDSERALVEELLRENEVLTAAARIYEEVRGPAYEYQLTLEALNELLEAGRINQDEFSNSVLRARITFLDSQRDMASGLERGFLKILEKTGDFATQMEDIVTSAFDGMSQAIADLVVDGEADFGSLIKSINKQIIQLVVSQAFKQLFGNTGISDGQAGGNIFGSLFSGLKGLFGFQNGGSFTVGSQTGIAPLPGADNRLVAFRAQDGEDVTVTPRGQKPGGGNQQVVVNFNISTPDVNSFKQSQSQLAAKAARMISQGQRNM
jgi:tape measure domain-containing protein